MRGARLQRYLRAPGIGFSRSYERPPVEKETGEGEDEVDAEAEVRQDQT
jgi:hypothetical protein